MIGAAPQLTPTAGRTRLQKIRPSVSEAIDLARARGKIASGTGVPSRMPGEPPIFVGSGAHADVKVLDGQGITAVLNCAPLVCKDPVAAYEQRGIRYLALDAQDDRHFAILEKCLPAASDFISSSHAEGRAVLVHCMAGVNRSATLTVAYLLLRERRNLFELFAECSAARPSILQNPAFQLQLCSLAHRHGLLTDIGEDCNVELKRSTVAPSTSPVIAKELSDGENETALTLLDGDPERVGSGGDAAAREQPGNIAGHVLTGNREMAEDLERLACEVCGRTFAPSVHVRHVPICIARAAKGKAPMVQRQKQRTEQVASPSPSNAGSVH